MTRRRRGNGLSRESASVIGALILAIVSIATLLILPLSEHSRGAKALAGFGIAIGVCTVLGWLLSSPADVNWVWGGLATAAVLYGFAIFNPSLGVEPRIVGAGSPVELRADEVLLAQGPAEQLGRSRLRGHVGLGSRLFGGLAGGAGLSFPIDGLSAVDEGEVVVTDQRVIFAGLHKTTTFSHGDIAGVEFSGAVLLLRRQRGKNLILKLPDPAEVVAAIRAVRTVKGTSEGA